MDISILKEEYDKEGDFKIYTDKYMKKHGIVEVLNALKCIMVQEYYLYLHKGAKENYEYPQ